MAETTNFELVSPERLLVSRAVEMVVMPGSEGLFGVLPRHAPLISTLDPGVIQIYEGGQVKERIFVAGGFAEVTATRCTVLAEEAMPVGDIERAAVERRLKELGEDLADARDEAARTAAAKAIAIAKAKLAAIG
ncbi:MAG: hypothetical protein OHK0024_20800 [Thalassobaculales bacterium]